MENLGSVGICPHLILAETLESEGAVYEYQINLKPIPYNEDMIFLFSIKKQLSRQETCYKNRTSLFVPCFTLYGIAV